MTSTFDTLQAARDEWEPKTAIPVAEAKAEHEELGGLHGLVSVVVIDGDAGKTWRVTKYFMGPGGNWHVDVRTATENNAHAMAEFAEAVAGQAEMDAFDVSVDTGRIVPEDQ